jgi:hypothetical protein
VQIWYCRTGTADTMGSHCEFVRAWQTVVCERGRRIKGRGRGIRKSGYDHTMGLGMKAYVGVVGSLAGMLSKCDYVSRRGSWAWA